MEEMSIGEFARRSRLSPKALRLYDGLGLLSPARVDELSGYRYYEGAQLGQARLIAALRQVGIPLSTVKELLALGPAEMAERVTAFWREAEVRHAGQRELVTALVDRLTGRSTVMYEVATREMPQRSLLCLKRNVDASGLWALGKEFVALVRGQRLPRIGGREGAAFCIYWGQVSADSDGPVEWCRPVPPPRPKNSRRSSPSWPCVSSQPTVRRMSTSGRWADQPGAVAARRRGPSELGWRAGHRPEAALADAGGSRRADHLPHQPADNRDQRPRLRLRRAIRVTPSAAMGQDLQRPARALPLATLLLELLAGGIAG